MSAAFSEFFLTCFEPTLFFESDTAAMLVPPRATNSATIEIAFANDR
jgi:hypothetical protein